MHLLAWLIQPRLTPHEGRETDVVLLGHSMGGILSAEVTLLNKHRILGTVNFDTPFLGMHPGVIASGLGSLFMPAPELPATTPQGSQVESPAQRVAPTDFSAQAGVSVAHRDSETSSMTGLIPTKSTSTTSLPTVSSMSLDLPTKDPNYDPPFSNDTRTPQRTGWANAFHFLNKHSDGLANAMQAYVKSHWEFGGTMADYKGLKSRYEQLRALDDLDMNDLARTRFVNYYTASTGRPKKPKSQPGSRTQTGQLSDDSSRIEEETHRASLEGVDAHSVASTPKLSMEAPEGGAVPTDETRPATEHRTEHRDRPGDDGVPFESDQELDHVDPTPITDCEPEEYTSDYGSPILQLASPTGNSSSATDGRSSPRLPPIPPTPEEPPEFDPTPYTDRDALRLAEKEYSRKIKAHQRAMKDREKTISDRRKYLEKKAKEAAKEREKALKAQEKERMKGMEKGERERAKQEAEDKKRAEKEEREEKTRIEKERAKAEKEAQKNAAGDTISLGKASSMESKGGHNGSGPEKPKRDKKFCILPPKVNGRIDPCWVRVFMPGMDEVGAHCGLFNVDGERYRTFVGEVADRIELWIEESTGR